MEDFRSAISKIDGSELTTENWVVSLIVKKHHAIIVMEGEIPDKKGEGWFWVSDFLPQDRNGQICYSKGPKFKEGEIRIFKSDNIELENGYYIPGELMDIEIMINRFGNICNSSSSIPNRQNDNSEDYSLLIKEGDPSKSWKIPRYVGEVLQRKIYAEKRKPPNFHINGSQSFFSNGAYNCITWAEKKLEDAKINTHSTIFSKVLDNIIAIPDVHLKNNSISASLTATKVCLEVSTKTCIKKS